MSFIVTVALLLGVLKPERGNASQYDPGVMERVVANRQAGITDHDLPAELPPVAGFVAVKDCGEIGNVWLVRPEGGVWEFVLVADCSGHEETSDWMRENGILIEVDHKTAIRWDVVGIGVEVEVIKAVSWR
jgi:hypothetical protein